MNSNHTVCIHEAASNNDANLLAMFLSNAGIEAHAVEDNSAVGLYSLGTLPGIHQPKVFVHRNDVRIAREMVARFEKKQPVSGNISDDAFCYHCGAECKPNAESCNNCGRILDQDEESDAGDSLGPSDDLRSPTDNSTLQDRRKLVVMLLLAMPVAVVIFFGCLLAISYVMSLSD